MGQYDSRLSAGQNASGSAAPIRINTTLATTRGTVTATAATAIAANINRKYLCIQNQSGAVALNVGWSESASAGFFRIDAGAVYEPPIPHAGYVTLRAQSATAVTYAIIEGS